MTTQPRIIHVGQVYVSMYSQLLGILGGQIEEKLLLKPLTALLMDGKNEGVYYEGTLTACSGF